MGKKSLTSKAEFRLVPWAIALVVIGAILKLCGVIRWGWAIITAPIWLPFAAVLIVACIFIGFAFAIAGIIAGTECYFRSKHRRSFVPVSTKNWRGLARDNYAGNKVKSDESVNA